MDSLEQSQLLQLFDSAIYGHQTQPGIALPSHLENFEWIENTLAGGDSLNNSLPRSSQAISIILQALKPVCSAFRFLSHKFHQFSKHCSNIEYKKPQRHRVHRVFE